MGKSFIVSSSKISISYLAIILNSINITTMNDFNSYNFKLKNFARKHRNNSTKAEIKLWSGLLRGKQFHGLPFKRQRPIDWYIADFVCLPIKLIIEVDGISHTWEGAQESDEIRTERLNELGFTVYRIDDSDVLNHLDKVYDRLTEWLVDYGHIDPPPCEPSMRGIRADTKAPVLNEVFIQRGLR
ncbi:MAG: DUF559 domain-containing protein [Cytophagaceae bacterium]